MTQYTKKNIEDWDFRTWVSPVNGDPSARMLVDSGADRFLSENFTTVIATDAWRLTIFKQILKSGYASLDEQKEHVVLTPAGVGMLPYMTSWRDMLTSHGRFNRKIVKALVREWGKNGRLRFTILPNMQEQFPGLFES